MDENNGNGQLVPVESEEEKQRRINELRMRNLRNFPKGTSGNPKGRPRASQCMTTLLKRELKALCEGDPKGRKNQEVLAWSIVRQAIKGNKTAMQIVVDRVDGKLTDKMEVTGAGGGPVIHRIEVEFVRRDGNDQG